MSETRKKLTTQVNSEILSAVRSLAEKEGRQLQALVDEAFADLIEKRKQATPRAHVMGVYFSSPKNTDRFTRSSLNDGLSYRSRSVGNVYHVKNKKPT